MCSTNYSLSDIDNHNSEEKQHKNNQKICGLCNINVSKYCCPRCKVLYCSLDCYKSEKHNICSESFYRDCVNEELATNHTDEKSRQKMIDILKKMQDEENPDFEIPDELIDGADSDSAIDSDDDAEVDLQDRIKNLDLDDPDALWSALTEDERNEFEALLNQGDVGSIVPHWEPWWMYRKEEKLVEDVSNIDNAEKEALKSCPPLITVPKLTSLTTVQPSPAIRMNITNILASYTFVMRYFNGEVDPAEGTLYLLNICANLDRNANFEDLATAVESVAQKCLQSDLIQTDKESLEVMKHDTFLLLQGPSKVNKIHYCKSALSHLHKILTDAKNIGKIHQQNSKSNSEFSRKFPEHKKEHLPNLDASKVKRCLKKIEYCLSFLESYDMEFE